MNMHHVNQSEFFLELTSCTFSIYMCGVYAIICTSHIISGHYRELFSQIKLKEVIKLSNFIFFKYLDYFTKIVSRIIRITIGTRKMSLKNCYAFFENCYAKFYFEQQFCYAMFLPWHESCVQCTPLFCKSVLPTVKQVRAVLSV